MKKLLKFGIASLSFFVLNAYIQTNAKADEQVATTNIAILESPSANFSTSATDENTTSTEILKNDPYAKTPVNTIKIILAIHAKTFSTVLLNGFIINPSSYKIKGFPFY